MTKQVLRNARKIWATINEITHNKRKRNLIITKLMRTNGTYAVDDAEIANILNSHFVKTGIKLTEKIPDCDVAFQSFLKSSTRK